MDFFVYRVNRKGEHKLTARCVFIQDALSVMKNWHKCYVVDNRVAEVVRSRGISKEEVHWL